MQKLLENTADFVIGMADGAMASDNARERQTALIENMVRQELIDIWRRDELPIEIVLGRIEELEKIGWRKTLEWLGHFYTWDSYRYMWDATFDGMAEELVAQFDDMEEEFAA